MSCCARCGQGFSTCAGKIALNKIYHRGCFCCYNCHTCLNINNAKIFYGEVFCECCCPEVENVFPVKVCRVNSTPSANSCCLRPVMVPPKCCQISSSSESCERARDVHSCSCIPGCCRKPKPIPACFKPKPCRVIPCDDPCRVNYCRSRSPCEDRSRVTYCRPRAARPTGYPPRSPSPICPCGKCYPCKKPPRRRDCSPPCMPCCTEGKKKKKVYYIDPCDKSLKCVGAKMVCKPDDCQNCRRCCQKVFAAEKVLTACGAYHIGCFSCKCCCKSLCVKTMFEACGEIYCKRCYNNYFGLKAYGY